MKQDTRNTSDSEPILLNIPQVAALLNVPEGTVRNNATRLPRQKIGRRYVYRRDLLVQLVRECPEHVNFFDFAARRKFERRQR